MEEMLVYCKKLEDEAVRMERVFQTLHARTKKAEELGLKRVTDGLVLEEENVEWIVNDFAELGVKIGNQCFFMYKGRSLNYKELGDGSHEMKWRPVYKREFGEGVHVPPKTEHSFDRGEVDEEHNYTFGEGWELLP